MYVTEICLEIERPGNWRCSKIWQLRFVRARRLPLAVDFNTYMGLLAKFWLVLVFWIRSIYFLEFISKFKLCIVFVTRFLNLYCCVHWLFEVHAGNKVLFKHAILPNVIIYKSRCEPFLCNRIWCLGWFWAGWQYWKLLELGLYFWWQFFKTLWAFSF